MTKGRWVWLFAGGLLLAVALLAEIAIERVLVTRVPELLARITERPVSLGEVDVDLFDLAASTTELRIGPAQQTALLAEHVRIQVDAAALLSGEVRFTTAAADYLSLDLAPWRQPGERSRDVAFYRQVLNRWLPVSATLDTLAVFDGEVLLSLTEELDWARQPDRGQSLAWRQAGLTGELALRLETTPVAELLQAQRGRLRLRAVRLSAPDEELSIALDVVPVADGVMQTFAVNTPAIVGEWRFVTPELLMLPTRSKLELSSLDLDILADNFGELMAQPGNTLPAAYMQNPLPLLDWPEHSADVRIAELIYDDQSYQQLAAAVEMTAATEQSPARAGLVGLSAQSDAATVAGDIELLTGSAWQVAIDLKVASREDGALAGVFGATEWRWQQGTVDFVSSGRTLLELMSRARGRVEAQGEYYADTALPLQLEAEFDGKRGLLGADELLIRVGQSSITGEVWTDASGAELHARLESPFLNLDRLRETPRSDSTTGGLSLPNLDLFPSALPLDVEFTGQNVRLGGRTYARVSLDLDHTADGADFALRLGRQESGLDVTAKLVRGSISQTLEVDADVRNLSMTELGTDIALQLRDARLRLQGAGAKWSDLFSGMSGDIRVSARAPDFDGELTGASKLAVESRDLTIEGFALDELTLSAADATAQGWLRLNLAEPGISGALAAEQLDVDALRARYGGETAEQTTVIADQISALPNGELRLSATQVTMLNRQFDEFSGVVRLASGDLQLDSLVLAADFGRYTGTARLHAEAGQARLDVSGPITELRPSQLFDRAIFGLIEEPLQGEISLQAQGVDWSELATQAKLGLDLRGPNRPATPPFDIDVLLQFDGGNGIQAEITSMQWRNSDLRGTVNYVEQGAPDLRAKLLSDRIDLTAFTDDDAGDPGAEQQQRRGIIGSVAEITQGALGLFTGTVRDTLTASESADPKSARFFSTEPWPNETLDRVRLDVALEAAEVRAPRWVAEDVRANVDLRDSILQVHAASPDTNGGRVDIGVKYDASVSPPQAEVDGSLVGVRPRPAIDVAPLSLYTKLRGRGASEAELVASVNGPVYIEAGRGVTDFGSLGVGILAGDLVQAIFTRLLPSAETAPRLSCAVGYGQFDAGITKSPAALVIATAKMNVVVRAQLDFVEEKLTAQFGSRTRTGTGISVGNVFSNTVRLEGPLTRPKIVPQTTSLLWRYGAAVATGGLTLLGESMYKRVMADRKPCDTMKTLLREQVCVPGGEPAESELVCPG